MDDIARDVARQTAPWKAGQDWWVVGIEGIVALIIGVYIVANPISASDIIRVLLAVVLLALSFGQIVDGFRFRDLPGAPWATLRGGAGGAVALLTLLSERSLAIAPIGARQMLALGLLVYGILGVVALVVTLGKGEFTVGSLIADILTIVLGALLLTANPNDTSGVRLLGWVAIVGGIALLIFAYLRTRQTRAAA
jgi:uncharacterized membrane protein HdeD (DUF308 family)